MMSKMSESVRVAQHYWIKKGVKVDNSELIYLFKKRI